jgi:hypothetical protein
MDNWTLPSFIMHTEFRFSMFDRLLHEMDRRYTEVSSAKAEALQIKAEGDRRALELAREMQDYRDQMHNGLLNQLKENAGKYATHAELCAAVEKLEAVLKPITTYVASQQGKSSGLNAGWGYLVGLIGLLAAIAGLASRFLGN